MSVSVSISFANANPSTIWNRLAEKLGRSPTNAEARDEVRRILTAGMVEMAEAGRLSFQRKSGRAP